MWRPWFTGGTPALSVCASWDQEHFPGQRGDGAAQGPWPVVAVQALAYPGTLAEVPCAVGGIAGRYLTLPEGREEGCRWVGG